MAGSIRITITSTEGGPIFDGRAARAVRDFCDDIEQDAADWTLRHIRNTYHRSFKRPTGYYETLVNVSNLGGDPVVNDGGTIAYGPWLEGVGSRNNNTRFKGYHAFRKAASALDRRIEDMGDRLMTRVHIRRIG